jgi:hypothetical protein
LYPNERNAVFLTAKIHSNPAFREGFVEKRQFHFGGDSWKLPEKFLPIF